MKRFLEQLRVVLLSKKKSHLLLLLGLSVLVSMVETVGVSAVMPFITIAGNFAAIKQNAYLNQAYTDFGFSSEASFVATCGVGLFLFYVARALFNFGYFHLLARVSFGVYYDLICRIFANFLHMPYSTFTEKNRSYMTKTLINECASVAQLMQGVLLLISESFVIVSIYTLLLYMDWRITLGLTAFLLAIGSLVAFGLKSKIKSEGIKRESSQKYFYELLNRTFGNYKLIKISSATTQITDDFNRAGRSYADVNIRNTTMQHIPRITFEALGFSFVVLFISYLLFTSGRDISSVMGLLSVFVLGLYRLLPSVSRIVAGLNEITFNRQALEVVYQDLLVGEENLGQQPITYQGDICLENINFRYNDRTILENVTFSVSKGSKIAFIGESGSGKTTLVDIMIGLMAPTRGQVTIGGVQLNASNMRAWRGKIGYVPQSIFLFDGSVAENVVFGRTYDEDKLIRCLKQAEIYDFLQTKQGLQTFVGDGGVLLSGGQRQRIAIARVLYGDPEVLVLDEATSALDHETEAKIMDQIYALSADKTLIVVAHRLTTIERCERIYRVGGGVVTEEQRSGKDKYEEVSRHWS